MKRVHPLPTMLTLANFGCGLIAIILSARSLIDEHAYKPITQEPTDFLFLACACVFLAMLFDMLDGKVARMTGSACRFGGELDSLADVVSFGIVPAIIYTIDWLRVEPEGARWWSMVLGCGMVYAICACLRLARYNVEMDIAAKDCFRGLPSPAAAGAVVSMFLLIHKDYIYTPLSERWGEQIVAKGIGVYLLLIGLLMVSRVRYAHLSNRLLGGRKRFTHLVLAIFILFALWLHPVYVLVVSFNAYVAHGVVSDLLRRFRKQHRPGAGGTPPPPDNSSAEKASSAPAPDGAHAPSQAPGAQPPPPETTP